MNTNHSVKDLPEIHEASLQDMISSMPEPMYGIISFYNIGLQHAFLQPDHSMTSSFQHHRAYVGILWSNQSGLPLGVETYIPSKNYNSLESTSRPKLIWLILKTAWTTPFVTKQNRKYKFAQAIFATLVIVIVQPLYEIGWQIHNLWHKLRPMT